MTFIASQTRPGAGGECAVGGKQGRERCLRPIDHSAVGRAGEAEIRLVTQVADAWVGAEAFGDFRGFIWRLVIENEDAHIDAALAEYAVHAGGEEVSVSVAWHCDIDAHGVHREGNP